jgi:hypothetical protein
MFELDLLDLRVFETELEFLDKKRREIADRQIEADWEELDVVGDIPFDKEAFLVALRDSLEK